MEGKEKKDQLRCLEGGRVRENSLVGDAEVPARERFVQRGGKNQAVMPRLEVS